MPLKHYVLFCQTSVLDNMEMERELFSDLKNIIKNQFGSENTLQSQLFHSTVVFYLDSLVLKLKVHE